jgi:hypothetical protein
MTDYTAALSSAVNTQIGSIVDAAVDEATAPLQQELDTALGKLDDAKEQIEELKARVQELQDELGSGEDPEPEQTPTAFGVNLKDYAALQAAKKAGVPLQAVRIFYNAKSPLPVQWSDDRLLAALTTEQRYICISYKADTPAQVSRFCDSIPTELRGGVWMVRHHEPENDNLDTSQFRADQAAHAEVVRATGCHPAVVLMSWTLEPKSGRDWHDWVDPSAVDGVFWDSYNSQNKKGTGYEAPASMLDAAVAASRSVGKPWALCETGSLDLGTKDGVTRKDWVASLADYVERNGALFATYFNRVMLDGSGDYTLSQDELSVWKAV